MLLSYETCLPEGCNICIWQQISPLLVHLAAEILHIFAHMFKWYVFFQIYELHVSLTLKLVISTRSICKYCIVLYQIQLLYFLIHVIAIMLENLYRHFLYLSIFYGNSNFAWKNNTRLKMHTYSYVFLKWH